VIPDVDGDERRGVILVQRDAKTVGESELLELHLLREERGGEERGEEEQASDALERHHSSLQRVKANELNIVPIDHEQAQP
jgi:hypothetical protein